MTNRLSDIGANYFRGKWTMLLCRHSYLSNRYCSDTLWQSRHYQYCHGCKHCQLVKAIMYSWVTEVYISPEWMRLLSSFLKNISRLEFIKRFAHLQITQMFALLEKKYSNLQSRHFFALWWLVNCWESNQIIWKKESTMTGLEPAIPRSEVWCLIH